MLELLVVVGILAALVALALPFYQDYVNQSKLTAAEADLQTFKKALAMYDQLESSNFTDNTQDLRSLIGKYLQDFRKTAGQQMPVDPWQNDYEYDVAAGSIWSYGPDGVSGVAAGSREVTTGEDDVLVTWKPDFFIVSARKVNSTTIEITFSRKITDGSLTTALVTPLPALATVCSAVQKVSPSIYRLVFDALPANGTVTISDLAAQDGRLLSVSDKPDNPAANTATF